MVCADILCAESLAKLERETFGHGARVHEDESAAMLQRELAAMGYKPPTMPAGVGPVQTSDSVPDKLTNGRSAIYVNRTIFLALDLQAQNKTNILLKMDEWDGHVVLTYRGIPIRNVDALTITESRVT